MYDLIIYKQTCMTMGAVWISKKNHIHRQYPHPQSNTIICNSNLAHPRLLDRVSCLALNQIELDATNRRFVILGTKHDKAEYPAKMRNNYCPHLNPSHRETLLSLHLRYELLQMAHKVTGTSHPFLQKIEEGQATSWQAMPYMTEYQSYSNKRNKQTSIYRGHKEVIIIVMSLCEKKN